MGKYNSRCLVNNLPTFSVCLSATGRRHSNAQHCSLLLPCAIHCADSSTDNPHYQAHSRADLLLPCRVDSAGGNML